MLKIPRYDMWGTLDGQAQEVEKPDGDWCKWEDVQAALEQAVRSVGQKTTKWRLDEEGDVNDHKA